MSYNQTSWNVDYKLSSVASDIDGAVANSTYVAGRLPLGGLLATISGAILPVSGKVYITSVGDDSAVNFTITGTWAGAPVSEILAGANAGTVTSVQDYDFIISAESSAATAGNIEVGFTSAGDELATTQTLAGADPIDLDGAYKSGTSAVLTTPAFLVITFADDETGKTLTVTGTDINGDVIVEQIAGVNATTATSLNVFASITNVEISADAAGNLQIGNSASTASPWIYLDLARQFFYVTAIIGVSAGATLNYTLQYANFNQQTGELIGPLNDSYLSSQTASSGTYLTPADAVRLVLNSWTSGTATLSIRNTCGHNSASI